MGAIDYAIQILKGNFLDSGDPARSANAAFEEVIEHALGADADGAFSEVPLAGLDDDFEFVSASIAPSATLTANTVTYFTLSILKYNASGASGTTIANFDTSTTTITAKTTTDFTNVAGTELLVDGGYLGLVGAAASIGASLPASKIKVRLRRRS